MKPTHSTIAIALLLTGAASAQVVASDNFSYVGALTANGWTAHSGAGNKVIMSNGSYATLDQSAGSGEDVNLAFPAFGAADTIYASFTLNVPSGNPVNPDGEGTYFVHFKDTGSLFRARTGVLSPAAGGDFQLAINADNANLGAGAQWPVDLVFDTNYTVVIDWNAATGESHLWLNPYAETSPSIAHTGAATGTIIEQFALRQSNDHTGFIHIDDVVVGHTFADVLCASPNSISVLDTPDCATATFEVTGSPVAGSTVTATLNGATIPLVIASGATINLSLLPVFACDCVLVPAPDVIAVGTSLPIAIPPALPAGVRLFLQGADLTATNTAASPCSVTGLFLGLTDAVCIVTG
ncbi:MAG TPA: hypothetical protein VFZ65_11700 [Planctomycetota bacterium]|nr:hypothetical protein [Planctomycetota bacterium]